MKKRIKHLGKKILAPLRSYMTKEILSQLVQLEDRLMGNISVLPSDQVSPPPQPTSLELMTRYMKSLDLTNLTSQQLRFLLGQMLFQRTGDPLDLENPQSFNEKIQWLKCYYRDPLITQCADKVAVRDYISETVGKEYLVPALGIYDRPEDIDFSTLPQKFVIKVNWGWGQNIVCVDKSQLDIAQVRKQLAEWMLPENNHYFHGLEWCYKDIQPKILIEQYIEHAGDLLDYKFLCFNGEPYYMYVSQNRTPAHDKMTWDFFDREYNWLPFTRFYPNAKVPPQKPTAWDEMLRVARALARPFPFVRVDMYENQGQIKIGELTFYPDNGTAPFEPREWDYVFGQRLRLPEPNAVFAPPRKARSADARLVEALIGLENRFGGLITDVPRNKVSPHDPRTPEELRTGGMIGGDRMSRHAYALKYAQYLKRFLHKRPLVLAEVGILCGTGLAIWCDLFRNATILGLDIDPAHFYKNRAHLLELGAFRKNAPHIFEFDQLADTMSDALRAQLTEHGIDILIDDGVHSAEAIENTMVLMKPFLKDDFVYFIEDNPRAGALAELHFKGCTIDCDGELTIITPRNKS